MWDTLVLWVHPAMQSLAVLIGLLAMWQGWKRIEMLWGRKVIFPWRTHVRLGTVGLLLWTAGAFGFYVTHSLFGATHITGIHATLAWPIIVLSILGLITGGIMNKYKKKRFWLPLIHGVGNTILMILVLYECWTGIDLYDAFMA